MRRKAYIRLVGIAASFLLLTGCTGTADTEEAQEPLSVPPATGGSIPEPTAHQGPQEMALGEEAVVVDSYDEMMYRFKINAIDAVTECPNWPEMDMVENGYLVRLDIEEQIGDVANSQDAFVADMAEFGSGVNQAAWSFVAENGTRANEIMTPITYNCQDQTDRLPDTMLSNQQAVGGMLLDLPSQSGTLIYSDPSTQQRFQWSLTTSGGEEVAA